MQVSRRNGLKTRDDRVIIHFDYDCFYAAVFEAENPALRNLPLAVQQKQIIVTCNYEARRQGLHKLQLITEARQICPEVIIVLGEDLTRFRNASKALFEFLQSYIWSHRAERLGFDEVFLDVTDMIQYNLEFLNAHDLAHCFFHLSKNDPTVGFPYDATEVWGHAFPSRTKPSWSAKEGATDEISASLENRLILGSHLAQFLRRQLEAHHGYTATVGISTSKLLSKLVGNCHKPNSQTTLRPPYTTPSPLDDNVTTFIDAHDVGKIPGIGFKFAQKIRHRVLGRAPNIDEGLIYGGTKEDVTVCTVRRFPGMGPELLDQILGGPGAPRDIGPRIWGLLHGVDDAEVERSRRVPKQISIEDSYLNLDNLDQIQAQLQKLSRSLLYRMQVDLLENEVESEGDGAGDGVMHSHDDRQDAGGAKKRWIAHPRTLRLTTRPRPPRNRDGSRSRSFKRISRSGPMPHFVFSLSTGVEATAAKLVQEALWPQFKKLHPDTAGLDLSLVNVAATNIVEAAVDERDGPAGADRDIKRMFTTQERVLKEWQVEDRDVPPAYGPVTKEKAFAGPGEGDMSDEDGVWAEDEDATSSGDTCSVCGTIMPLFAMPAHQRFHEYEDQ